MFWNHITSKLLLGQDEAVGLKTFAYKAFVKTHAYIWTEIPERVFFSFSWFFFGGGGWGWEGVLFLLFSINEKSYQWYWYFSVKASCTKTCLITSISYVLLNNPVFCTRRIMFKGYEIIFWSFKYFFFFVSR